MNHFKLFDKSFNKNNNDWFSFKYFVKFSNNKLHNKYSSSKYSFSSICIKNLIFNEKCRIVSRFKEYLIYDDDTDFLRNIYEKEQLKNSLKKIVDFYDKYNKVFPNYMILPENIFMYKNLRKKQKMIDEKNRIKMEKAKKDNNKKINLQEKNDIKVNICFFDEKIKENINKQNNSLLTLSLTNTIISNNINNNDNKKNDNNLVDNNSFVESNINNSSINISLYSKRKKFKKNENNNNYALFDDDTLKSQSSLENIVDILNNNKNKKRNINNKIKNKKVNKLLNIDIISINNTNNNYNKILTNNFKTQDYVIKTPTKNKLLKKDKDIKQQNKENYKSLNNNRTIFNHKKNISGFHSFCPNIRNTVGKILSKKKTTKYISKFPKESKNIIDEITSSIIGKYKISQRNKKKIYDGKNLFNNKKKENLTLSNDNYERLNTKASNNSKEKRIKLNNYFIFKRINKYSQNNNILKYNKIIKKLKNNEEEKNKNKENNKIYEIFKEKYKSHFNNEIKEKRRDFNRKIIDTNSTDSTKISLNNRKSKFLTYDKLNNSNNLLYLNNNLYNSNNEVIPIQSKEEYIFNCNTINNFNQNNYQNTINNTENNLNNKYIYTLTSNLGKINQKQNKICIENKKLHKKHKTFSSQVVNNNFNFINWCAINEEYKINCLNNKLKKIKEEIIKNNNNYKEIKEKYRKLSENNPKKILTYPQTSCQKIFEKDITCTAFNNNSVEKRQNNKKKSNIINRRYNNELFTKIKIKTLKKDKNIFPKHQRNFSLINNNKKPIRKQMDKEVTKENILKSKDKILSNKINIKKIKYSKKN